MKIYLLLLSSLLVLQLNGQNCPYYDKYVQRGDAIMRQGDKADFEAAINAYSTAMLHCPSKAEAAQQKIIAVFKTIEALKKKTDKALEDLKVQQAATEQARNEADSALQQAKKLIDAFYFYGGRFALAYGEKNGINVFYFIDKNGDEVEKLGRWEKAEQFDGRGLARIQRWHQGRLVNFLLDTVGTTYQVVDDVKALTPEVTALDLSGKNLDTIPDAVYAHLPLKVLLLSINPIVGLNTNIGNLEELRFLSLSGTNIDFLPSSIGNLRQLQYLNLRGAKFDSLPNSIGNLTQLQSLDLSETKIESLPSSVGNLKQLQSLNLRHSAIELLPNSIGNLTQLQSLDLSVTNISTLPNSIGNLTQLQSLDLSVTKISAFPDSIGNLKQLKNLNLTLVLTIDSLPNSIGNLTQLQSLNLSSTHIKFLPQSIGNLPNLQSLDLSKSSIKLLPRSITELKKLQSLDLSYTKVDVVPQDIGNLAKLQSLDLSGTKVDVVPNSIGNLAKLQSLDLSGTKVDVVPNSIGNLAKLQSLDLSGTKVDVVPQDIENLTKLQSLNLSNTKIDVLPNSIGTLTLLKSLSLRDTKIDVVPNSIGNLRHLLSLDLSGTKINVLPGNIQNLTQLQFLYLNGTGCRMLPIQLSNLKQLRECDARNSPILISTQESIRQLMPWCRFRFSTQSDLASFFHEKNNHLEAYIAIKRATEEDPKNYYHWHNLSFYALFVQKPHEAILAAKKVLELDSTQAVVETNLALGYLLNGQWPEAEKIYQRWKGKKFPNNSRLWDEIFVKDIAALEAADINPPDFEKFRTLFKRPLALLYHENNKHEQAYTLIKKASEEDPQNVAIWRDLSQFALFVQKPQEAILAAKKVLELNPEQKSIEANLALAFLLNNQWLEAEKIYYNWKGKEFPDNHDLCDWVFLIDIYDLEATSIPPHPNFAKVKALFEEEE